MNSKSIILEKKNIFKLMYNLEKGRKRCLSPSDLSSSYFCEYTLRKSRIKPKCEYLKSSKSPNISYSNAGLYSNLLLLKGHRESEKASQFFIEIDFDHICK